MGGGILPATVHNNKVYLLFGKENRYADTPGWSDFGGGTENGEDHMTTAIREAQEELTGFLGGEKEITELLQKHGTFDITNKGYRMHIFPMKYDSLLPFYYNNNQRFLQRKLDPNVIKHTKIFEKAEIRWVCIDELDELKPTFRSYFQETVGLILKDKKAIESFVKKGLAVKKKKTASKKSAAKKTRKSR
jgi:8-oxo-dGTP pyrophosphatase MutT (NUDIX family)